MTVALDPGLFVNDRFLMAIAAGGCGAAAYAYLAWRFVLGPRERDTLRSGFAGVRAGARALTRRPRAVLGLTEKA